jgi:outer membrane protein OmpA-like peptidoglycan-associated protein
MRSLSSLIPCLLLLGSCGSPPKPPTVDESLKRPANTAMAVELQVCKNDLQNTRIVANESSRLAESAAATMERMAARQRALAALPTSPTTNKVYTLRFDFGSARVVVPADIASTLADEARTAPLVLLRGRTDGSTDAPVESRIARGRAAAVRDYLVGAGVDPGHIRATYQPAGDHVAENATPTGRGMNRRVEIEVYRTLPVALNSSGVALPSATAE